MIDTCSVRNDLESALSKEISISDEVLIYGAGNTSRLYSECFANEDINIRYFVDRDPDKVGAFFDGKEIISAERMADQCRKNTVLICTGNAQTYRAVKKDLDSMGMDSMPVDTYVFTKNREKILAVYDMLCDDISKATYANMILARMGLAEIDLSLVCENQYFGINEFAQYSSSEIFVDCGAFVGDTMERYLFIKSGIFGKIFAFEPAAGNFAAMECRAERLKKEWAVSDEKIELICAGIGETSETGYVTREKNGSASLGAAISEAGTGPAVRVYSIDGYFKDQRISFLKADIESYEEKMLRGAKNVIKRDKPKIAVCIYHNAGDMYRIPLLVSELCSDYRLSVRQHYGNLTETVLYAY